MTPTLLIIGLRNSGEEYAHTRHNAGESWVRWLARHEGASAWENEKNGEEAKGTVTIGSARYKAHFFLPDCFMNESGKPVKAIVERLKSVPNYIIVAHDDLDIPFGGGKVSFEKNSGGHKGVESVMRALKTKKFWRIRVGTATRAVAKAHTQSPRAKDEAIKTFVLKKFSPAERTKLTHVHASIFKKLASTPLAVR
ncbi:MAG: aminoacyl-tRNA hydrolase [Patescibacteria group bacterium]